MPSRNRPLRVLMEAELTPNGYSGGVEQFLVSVVHALGQIPSDTEEYLLLMSPGNHDWLEPHMGPNQKIVTRQDAPKPSSSPLRRQLRRWWRRARRVSHVEPATPPSDGVPNSDGLFESFGADLVVFPYQVFERCTLPTIFHPHDLQHLHYPQFLAKEELTRRNLVYRVGCRESTVVATGSDWVKNDVIQNYGVPVEKVVVIRRGSPTDMLVAGPVADPEVVRRKHNLPDAFALFPGQTWQHKNHLRLIEAVHRVRERHGLKIPLVCTGRKNDFYATIEQRIRDLNLNDQVVFPGYVDARELQALYHLAQFVVFPSLFEGGGFPVVEAFREGAPVTCSSATALPEYAGDAALLFDPNSVDSIAEALHRMATDADLRATLRRSGTERVQKYNWAETARAYRALYRRVAGFAPLRAE